LMTSPNLPFIRPEFSPLSIARAVWKGKFVLIMLWLLGSAATYVYVSRLPSRFVAQAVIMVDGQKIPPQYAATTVNTDVHARLASINQQILTSTPMQRIIEDLNLYQDLRAHLPIEDVLLQMRQDITVNAGRGNGPGQAFVIRVGYKGTHPAVVAQVANRVANLYIEENLKVREVQAEGTAEFVDSQLQEAKKRLDNLESAVSQYKIRNFGQLPQQEGALMGALGRMQMELQANADAQRRAEENKEMLEHTLAGAEDTLAAIQRAIETSSSVALPNTKAPPAAPQKKSDLLKAQLETLRLRYSDSHPEVRRVQAEMARAAQFEQEQGTRVQTPAASDSDAQRATAPPPRPAKPATPVELLQARDRITAIKDQIARATKEIELRKSERQRIQREIAVYQARVEGMPLREQEISLLTRDYENARSHYNALLGKKISADTARDLERRQKAERFTLLEPAQVPHAPVWPNRLLFNAIGSLAALGIAIGAVLAFELRRGVLLGEWELPARIPVLGRLPRIEIVIPDQIDSPGGRTALIKKRWSGRLFASTRAGLSIMTMLITGAGR
jgi:polysaccharide chain length determinant protein (PEP-CTERM system associated)